MNHSYDFNAPMFHNFHDGGSEEDLLDYFEADREADTYIQEEVASSQIQQTQIVHPNHKSGRRRSRSVGDLNVIGHRTTILSNAMNGMTVSESTESLDLTGVSSAESKENIHKGRSKDNPRVKYETMAEQVHRFHRQTPKRYHTVTSKANAIQVLTELHSNQYIKPKTPLLRTKSRSRPLNVMTHEERQELEYQEALKNKTKTRPFRREMLAKAPSLPNVQRIPVTKFEPFKLSKGKTNPNANTEEKPPVFRARSIPENILERPVGVKPKPPPKITIPITPNIKMPQKKTLVFPLRYNSPHQGIPFLPKPAATVVQPFSFEQRNQQLIKRKEEFVQKFIEDEKKTLETQPARPMPVFKTPQRVISKIPLVTAQTPKFASAPFRQENEKKFKAKLEQEQLEAKNRVLFKARPAKVLTAKPFEPELPQNHNLQIDEFQLSSDARAKARQAFDQKIKQKEQERQELLHYMELQRQKEEEEELIKFRKNLVPKAQPIKTYKPIVVKPSEKQITEPITPKLGLLKNNKN